jgi:hypothetical protein
MKSRLAVSFLFVLIASTFISDAVSDFKRLRSWGCGLYRSHAVSGKNYAAAKQSSEKRAISQDVKNFSLNSDEVAQFLSRIGVDVQSAVFRVERSNRHCPECNFIKVAGRRMYEVLGLLGIP